MSQIGRKIINVPDNVNITNENNNIYVKGDLGELNHQFDEKMKIDISDDGILVSRPSDQKKYKELHGLTRSLINNMIVGVSSGYTRELTLVGTGYTADASKGNFLVLNVFVAKRKLFLLKETPSIAPLLCRFPPDFKNIFSFVFG